MLIHVVVQIVEYVLSPGFGFGFSVMIGKFSFSFWLWFIAACGYLIIYIEDFNFYPIMLIQYMKMYLEVQRLKENLIKLIIMCYLLL